MICSHCDKQITGRAFIARGSVVCGCCSCTLARQGPGFVGRDYPNQRDPYNYNAAKDQHLAIKYMADTPDYHPNHIDDRTAARWDMLFTWHADSIERYDKAHEREQAEANERLEHEERVGREEREKAVLKSAEEVCKISRLAESEGLEML